MEIGTEISQKIRSAIKAKLIELGAYVDDELPDYIMVMVANKKTQKQMADDLSLFLSHNTEKFTVWLQGLLKKLQSINTGQEPTSSKHKTKDKHKGEKRKHKSTDKSTKSGEPEKKKAASVGSSDKSVGKAGGDPGQDAVKDPGGTLAPAASAVETEINISENTDEFNEENKELEKKPETTKSSSTGKPPPGKSLKSKKSADDVVQSSKTVRRKSGELGDKVDSRKKPSSAVVAVKRKYEDMGEVEEEYDPTNPAVGNVASIVRGPSRKSSVPQAMQANKSLLMKAVSDAEKSVASTKKQDLPEKQEPGMHSDRKPVDLSRRMKTAAGLQLISRSKRKDLEKMTYTVSNSTGSKEQTRSTSGGSKMDKMQFTVKNDDKATPSKASTRSKAPLAGSSRMAASAIKDISKQSSKVNAAKKVMRDASPAGSDVDVSEDDGRSSAYSMSGDEELDESGSELEGGELDSDAELESDASQQDEIDSDDDHEEIEIEVTDRAAQTKLNMRDKNIRNLGKSPARDAEVQTEVVEFDVDGGLVYRLTKDRMEEIDKALLHVFVDNAVSFDFVENEAFRMFAKSLEPKYHFPKRKKLMTKIGMLYNQFKDHIKEDLSGAEFVTLTHYTWCTEGDQKYDTVRVHYLTRDWELRSAVVKTVALHGTDIEEQLAHHLEEARVKWGLKKPTLLQPSVSNTVSPSSEPEGSELEEAVFEMLGWRRVNCFGSCIQEVVRQCLNCPEVSQFLQKARDLIEELHKSSRAMEIFEKKKKLLLPKELQSTKLVADDRTNWSSTLTMMTTLTAQTPALHAAVMDSELMTQGVDFRSQLYNFIDQSTLEALSKIIQPFKTATELLTKNEVPTLQKILPIFIKLKKVLDEDQEDSELIKQQKVQIRAQMDSFFNKNMDTCLMACFVHPQTKQMAFVSQEDKDHVKKLIFEDIEEQFDRDWRLKSKEKEDAISSVSGQSLRQAGDSDQKEKKKRQTKAMSEMAEESDVRHVVVGKVDESDDNAVDTSDNKDSEDMDTNNGTSSQDDSQSSVKVEEDASRKPDSKAASGREVKESKPGSETKAADFSITVENDWLDDVICAAEEQKTPAELAKVELDLYMAEPASSKNPLEWWIEKQTLYPKISQVARRLLAIPASGLSSKDIFTFERHTEMKSAKVKPEHIDTMVFLKQNWCLFD